MAFKASLKHWLHRHRWLVSYRPEVDDGRPTMDPASDPFNTEANAMRTYESRGRLGDEELRQDELDLK